jgi:hypothetical protein
MEREGWNLVICGAEYLRASMTSRVVFAVLNWKHEPFSMTNVDFASVNEAVHSNSGAT